MTISSDVISLRQAARTWFAISLQTFGGPAGQIAVMQHTLVDTKRWISQRRFLHALNYCMLLPGPEAQQLAIYIGWLLNGTAGGLIAGILFVLPGVIALLALSAVYVAYGDTIVVTALFAGLAPAVLAIVAHAVWRIGRRSLTSTALLAVAAASFAAIAILGAPFPAVIAAAALAGWLLHRVRPHTVADSAHSSPDSGPPPLISDTSLHTAPASPKRLLTILAVGMALWAAPVAAVSVLFGTGSIFTQQAVFFSGTALITFGGAYAVLAYVAQQAVEAFGWLRPNEMIRGLALAESTPGPLIMVVQFVAFIAAYRNPGSLNPWAAAIIGALLTTWVTFVPCFLFIFLGAPYVERLRHNQSLNAALTGITAAVVGFIANLALYFASHTLFAESTVRHLGPLTFTVPRPGSVSLLAAGICALATLMLWWGKQSVVRTLAVCAVLGAGLTVLTGH